MLAQPHRLRSSAELRQVTRRGRRITTQHLVVHVLTRSQAQVPRAGFVVGKPVGNSVVRHRVTRQLRHLIAPLLPGMPEGTDLVVRALPGAHGADLAGELQQALAKAGLHA